MSLFSRDLLLQAFPDNPRLRGQFEQLDDFFTQAQEQVTELIASATDAATRLDDIESTGNQPFSDMLTAIAALDGPGAIEIIGPDDVGVRGIDSTDDACLVTRGQSISFAGKGATADRPVLSAMRRSIYFDTDLAAAGKPVFWTGSAWVDHTGTAV